MAQDRTATLRVSELAISHFRTFGSRTVMSFAPRGEPEAMVILQGDNGAGKSSALAGLELFFRAAIACLAAGASGSSDAEVSVRWDLITSVGHRDLVLRRRDRPAGVSEPTEIAVLFADPSLGAMTVRATPQGEGAVVKLTHGAPGRAQVEPDRAACEALLARMENPYGAGSRPLALLTARRRAMWLPEETASGSLPQGLATQLFRLRTSLEPTERRRWRAFVEVLGRYEAFGGKDVSVERLEGPTPQILVEDPGRAVVALGELGAGEQQLVTLTAALMLGRGAVLGIEKPESCLDARHQRTAQQILEAYAQGGLVDQVLLESNSPCFTRGLVLRFTRPPGGTTAVERVEAPAPRAARG